MKTTKPFTVYLADDERAALKERADANARSMAAQARVEICAAANPRRRRSRPARHNVTHGGAR
jgi:hypothetical protein